MPPENNIGQQTPQTTPGFQPVNEMPTVPASPGQPNIYPSPPPSPPKRSRKPWIFLILTVLVLVLVSVAYLVLVKKPAAKTTSGSKSSATSTGATGTPFLVYSDQQSIKAVGLDSKQIFSSKVATSGDFVKFLAKSPGGKLLFSEESGSAGSPIQYLLIDNQGNEKILTKTVTDSLSANTSQPAVSFVDESSIVYLLCPNSVTQTCKVTKLNLADGTSTAVYDTKAIHDAFSIPGDVLGISPDSSSVYIGMLVNSGTPQPAVYQVDVSSGKLLNTTKINSDSVTALSMSPDAKKVVYKSGGQNTPTVIHILDLASGQESTATWTNDYINDNSSELQWSPDSKKVLFLGNSSDAHDTAVYNLTTNKITNLQNIPDSAHHAVSNQVWLDNSTIFYEIDTSTIASDFRGSKTASYQQNVDNLKITKFNAPGGLLVAVIRP